MHGLDVSWHFTHCVLLSTIDLRMVFSLSAGMAWRELQAVIETAAFTVTSEKMDNLTFRRLMSTIVDVPHR